MLKKLVGKTRCNTVKYIFYSLCIIYISGVIAGSAFAAKNSWNIAFIEKVTFTENFNESDNLADLSRYTMFLCRDIACILSIILLKYSGIMKGICICVPFFQAVQNSSIFITDYINNKSLFNLITSYSVRNTASAFITLMFCAITIKDIFNNREDSTADLKYTIIYVAGIMSVYIIDYTIKSLFNQLYLH